MRVGVLVVVVVVIGLAGCGGGSSGSAAPSTTTTTAPPAGSPAAIAQQWLGYVQEGNGQGDSAAAGELVCAADQDRYTTALADLSVYEGMDAGITFRLGPTTYSSATAAIVPVTAALGTFDLPVVRDTVVPFIGNGPTTITGWLVCPVLHP